MTGMRTGQIAWLCIFAAATSAASAGCDRRSVPAEADASDYLAESIPSTDPPTRSPAEVARLLQSLYQARAYAEIAPWITEDRRESAIKTLEAIGQVIDANAALQAIAEQRYSGPTGTTWNLSAMENNLGPFSKRVLLISQRFRGDQATVTLQEGDNIPLVHAQFELAGGVWRFRPDPTPTRMAEELEELARILWDLRASVEGGAPLEAYHDAFAYRVLPQMAKVVTAEDDLSNGVVIGAAEE
jgi:hypothetical protein